MSFASRYEDPPAVWGVGRVVVHTAGGDVVHPWGVSEADVDDEAASMAERYRELGLGDDGLVLIVSLLSQAIHVVPLERAAALVGALYSSADATPFDAFRTASLVRQLTAKLVIGVDDGVLDGLAEQGRDLAEVFPGIPVLASGAGAAARLEDAGVTTGEWLKLGATSAFRAPGAGAFTYDAARWQVDASDDGELLLTNLAPRLTESQRFPTGVRGRVVEPGRLEVSASGSG